MNGLCRWVVGGGGNQRSRKIDFALPVCFTGARMVSAYGPVSGGLFWPFWLNSVLESEGWGRPHCRWSVPASHQGAWGFLPQFMQMFSSLHLLSPIKNRCAIGTNAFSESVGKLFFFVFRLSLAILQRTRPGWRRSRCPGFRLSPFLTRFLVMSALLMGIEGPILQ